MIKALESFDEIRPIWHNMYFPQEDTAFQSIEYNESCWECFGLGKKLKLLVYFDRSNQPMAILPLWLVKGGELRFINDRGTDYCDMIYLRNANMLDVVQEFVEFIDSMDDVKSVFLMNLRITSPLLAYFRLYKNHAFIYSLNNFSYLRCFQSETPLSNFQHLSSHRRKYLKSIITKSSN